MCQIHCKLIPFYSLGVACNHLLRALYGRQMCDTVAYTEVRVSKVTTLIGFYSPGCLKCVTAVTFEATVTRIL